jgi:hypothetical protein
MMVLGGDVGWLTFCAVDVMKSVLPEELHDEVPVGFNTVGHVGEYLSPTSPLPMLDHSF